MKKFEWIKILFEPIPESSKQNEAYIGYNSNFMISCMGLEAGKASPVYYGINWGFGYRKDAGGKTIYYLRINPGEADKLCRAIMAISGQVTH